MADDDSYGESGTSALPPRNSIPPFGALRAFDAVARLGGVRKAAEGLERDHAVISRHIRALEAWLGTVLVERTPSGVRLTDEGRAYHARITPAIDMISAATSDLMKTNAARPLQVWCMPGFALHWLNGRLGAFEQTGPGMSLEVRPTNSGPNFAGNDVDADIRFIPSYITAHHLPQAVRGLELAAPALIAVASPEYLANNPWITRPQDLLNHHLLHEEDFTDWRQWLLANGVDVNTDLAGPLLWQGHLTLDAARHGRGIALTNVLIAKEELAKGRLVNIGAGHSAFENDITGSYLFMARADRWDHYPIRHFRRWLKREITREMQRSGA